MNQRIAILKGLHPGIFLEHELQRRNLKKVAFALSLNEHPQTLVAIIKGRRRMNIALSLKIEKALGLNEGELMIMQVYFDIKKEQSKIKKEANTPDLNKLRKVLFWDTEMQKINWDKQKTAVIQRVFERGNTKEKKEIIRFYGKKAVDEIMKNEEIETLL